MHDLSQQRPFKLSATLIFFLFQTSSITHDLGILTFSMHEVDRYGIATVVERAIESINPRFVILKFI